MLNVAVIVRLSVEPLMATLLEPLGANVLLQPGTNLDGVGNFTRCCSSSYKAHTTKKAFPPVGFFKINMGELEFRVSFDEGRSSSICDHSGDNTTTVPNAL